jgi:hypothetical protein
MLMDRGHSQSATQALEKYAATEDTQTYRVKGKNDHGLQVLHRK